MKKTDAVSFGRFGITQGSSRSYRSAKLLAVQCASASAVQCSTVPADVHQHQAAQSATFSSRMSPTPWKKIHLQYGKVSQNDP